MATMNFSVPQEVKEQFNALFVDENKSHVVAELLKEAIEKRKLKMRRVHAIDALLKLRSKQKPVTDKMIQKARREGRS